jgi:hypothetical protein
MKIRIILLLVILAAVVSGGLLYLFQRRTNEELANFKADSDNLIIAFQQYKEIFGTFPSGDNLEISRQLFGKTEKKILIIAARKSQLNSKGEIVDPWGTPLQFYFSRTGILIRSAGPNKVWEDSILLKADDLYRSN